MSVPLRNGYGVRLPTVGGTKEERYSGVNALTILKKINCLCFCLLAASVSQPVSERRLAIDASFVAPVTIRAASCCNFSSS